jgi:hypothetical protein
MVQPSRQLRLIAGDIAASYHSRLARRLKRLVMFGHHSHGRPEAGGDLSGSQPQWAGSAKN